MKQRISDVTITDEGKVVVDLKGEYDYNGVNVLMDKLKKAQNVGVELQKIAKRKELLKANYK